ncbi:MAG: hypothetical protein RBT65_09835 [Methanolobus sp.]|nr:hypothetical protein [Methanolobus sp.]
MKLQLALGLGLGAHRKVGVKLDPATVAWRDSLAVDVGDARIAHYDAFFRKLKDNGMWDIADKIGLFCVGGLADARKNIKNPTATDETETGVFIQINAPSFTAYRGIERTEATNRIRTAAPSGNANYKLQNAGIIIGCETTVGSAYPEIAMAFSNNVLTLGQISPGTVRAKINCETFTSNLNISSVFAGTRDGSNVSCYAGDESLTESIDATAMPGELELLGYRAGSYPNNSRISFVWIGGSFTQSQFLAARTALLTLGGALGWTI